jgi:hypothetical protein
MVAFEKTWEERKAIIRQATKYNATCPRCGEQNLMWKLDWDDREVKLWEPYHFHTCHDGKQVFGKDQA